MRITDFDVYRDLLKEKCGLVLEQDQSYLLDSRLMPVVKKWGFSSLEAMTTILHGVPNKDLVRDVIEVMMTKDTCFFRDMWPFHMLRDEILTILKKTRSNRKLKIWCAVGGTGQEPYSVALLLKERYADFSNWKIDILSTDICTGSLEQAKQGLYSQFEVQRGLPIRTLLRHFKQVDDHNWQIAPDIRKMVRHQYFNLMDSMNSLGKFDIILCRNVLGSFDESTREKILEKLAGQLESDGFLMLGKGETAISASFRPFHEKRSVFVMKNGPHHTTTKLPAQTLAKGMV